MRLVSTLDVHSEGVDSYSIVETRAHVITPPPLFPEKEELYGGGESGKQLPSNALWRSSIKTERLELPILGCHRKLRPLLC